MILILINFHFLCISEYESMLVQAGSFRIPFSLLETVVSLLIYQVDFGRITQVVTTVEFVYTFKSECDAQPTRQGTFQI